MPALPFFSTNNLKQTVLSFTEYFLAGEDEQEERAKNLKKGRFFGETILFFHASVAAARAMRTSFAWLINATSSGVRCGGTGRKAEGSF